MVTCVVFRAEKVSQTAKESGEVLSMTEQTELMIDLSGIVKSEGMELAVSKEYPKEAFLEFDQTLSLETPVTLTGTITNHAGNLFLDGTLSFTVGLNCDRCLEPFSKQFTSSQKHYSTFVKASNRHSSFAFHLSPSIS